MSPVSRSEIIGKFRVARDRLYVYEDTIALTPEPSGRLLESAHPNIADGLVYTVAGFLLAIGRHENQFRSNAQTLSRVYPLVAQGTTIPLPSETELRAILDHWPSETRLTDIIDTRRRSVHEQRTISYTLQSEVGDAPAAVLAFWTAAVLVAEKARQETFDLVTHGA